MAKRTLYKFPIVIDDASDLPTDLSPLVDGQEYVDKANALSYIVRTDDSGRSFKQPQSLSTSRYGTSVGGQPIVAPIQVKAVANTHELVATDGLSVSADAELPDLNSASVANGQLAFLTHASLPQGCVSIIVTAKAGQTLQNGAVVRQAVVPWSNVGWIADKTRMTWWRLGGGDVLHARDFGATGDGVTDDTAALQAWLDAMPTNGGSLSIHAGTFRVSATLTVTQKYGFTIRGAGRGATQLWWGGNNSSSMLKLINCQYGNVASIYFGAGDPNISWMTHCECAVESHYQPGAPPPTQLTFSELEINGYAPSARAFDRGFRTTNAVNDFNNDGHLFQDITIAYCVEAGFSFEHGQSRVQALFNCDSVYTNYGFTTALGSGGAFNLYRGQGGGNTIDAYYGPPNENMLVDGFISEGSLHGVFTTGQTNSPFIIKLRGYHFSGDSMGVDGTDPDGKTWTWFAWYTHLGPFVIEDCEIGQGNNDPNKRIVVVAGTIDSSASISSYTIRNCSLNGTTGWGDDTTLGVLRSSYNLPLSAYAHIGIHGNLFTVAPDTVHAYPDYVSSRTGVWDVPLLAGPASSRLATPATTGKASIGSDDNSFAYGITYNGANAWGYGGRDSLSLFGFRKGSSTSFDELAQFVWEPAKHKNPSYVLQVILSATGGAVARVWVHNLLTNEDVVLNAFGDKDFVTDSSTPYRFTSANLVGAGGWSAGTSIYSVRASISDGAQSYIAGSGDIDALILPQSIPSGADGWYVSLDPSLGVVNPGQANMTYTDQVSGFVFQQEGGRATPTFLSNGLGGRPCLHGDGTRTLVSSTQLAYGTFTALLVYKSGGGTIYGRGLTPNNLDDNGETFDSGGAMLVCRTATNPVTCAFQNAERVPFNQVNIEVVRWDGTVFNTSTCSIVNGVTYPPTNGQGGTTVSASAFAHLLSHGNDASYATNAFLGPLAIYPGVKTDTDLIPYIRAFTSRYPAYLI